MCVYISYEYVHAVHGYDGHDPQGDRAEDEAAVLEGEGHGEHPRADVRLDDVHNGLQIGRAFAFRCVDRRRLLLLLDCIRVD